MVLTQEYLEREYPGLSLDAESGYRDSKSAAKGTILPDDNASDLEARGHLEGYALDLADVAALFTGPATPGGVVDIWSAVMLFVSPESAMAFFAEEIGDLRNMHGIEIQGRTLTGFDEFAAPELGQLATGIRLAITATAFGSEPVARPLSGGRGTQLSPSSASPHSRKRTPPRQSNGWPCA
jgi:hypothetical protein